MTNEVVRKEFYELFSPEDIEILKKADEIKKRVSVVLDTAKNKSYDFLERNGLLETGYEQDNVVLGWKKPYVKKMIDTDALKEQGLYESFLKEVQVKGSVTISIKYDD